MPLLSAKVEIPTAPRPYVCRDRLHRVLDEADTPVTLVSAPAGWGKTALLTAWARGQAAGRPLAWLSVEAGDEGDKFWSYLHAAIHHTVAGAERDSLAEPVPGPGAEKYPAQLADSLAHRNEPLVLVLDDLHHVRDASALRGLEALVRYSAGRLRLVLSTRVEPRLPWHRWRLYGELTELGAGQLGLTGTELGRVVAAYGLHLTPAQLERLHRITEGWPAGIGLAAPLLRQRQADGDGTGLTDLASDPRVVDYFLAEVLDDLPQRMRDTLTVTSVLDRFTGDLVDALTGAGDGDTLLAELARGQTFVTGADGGWYRCHPMFRQVLRAQVRRDRPDRGRALHQRAAAWHRVHGTPREALRHALAAADWSLADDVLTRHWGRLAADGPSGYDDGSGVSPVLSEPLPMSSTRCLAVAAEALDRMDLGSAGQWLRRAEERLGLREVAADLSQARPDARSAPDRPGESDRTFEPDRPGEPDPIEGSVAAVRVAAFRVVEARSAGDATALRGTGRHLLDLAEAGWPALAPEDGEWARLVAGAALGAAELALGRLDQADRWLRAASERAERLGALRARLDCSGRLALAAAVHGRLRAAADIAWAVLRSERPDLAGWRGGSGGPYPSVTSGGAHARLALAMVAQEQERIEEAGRNLGLVRAAIDAGAQVDPPLEVWTAVVLAGLAQDRGDLVAAYEALAEARRHLTGRLPPYLDQWLSASEADLRTARGDTGTVRRLAPRGGRGREAAESAAEAVALARAYLHDGDPTAAVRVLPAWSGDADGHPLRVRIDAGMVEALAARRCGDHRAAARSLERVLELAEPQGFRRTLRQCGPVVRDLLLDHLDSGTAFWPTVSRLLATQPPMFAAAPVGPSEPLTERELTILRYLQSILSNVEIAAELSVSVNTVKTHVRNIYRKLRAPCRRDAVRRARELHLL
ncbi:MAG TPA: LuxR C-terminal-related transcriptional regulator [Micromonosporaceae bacterium]